MSVRFGIFEWFLAKISKQVESLNFYTVFDHYCRLCRKTILVISIINAQHKTFLLIAYNSLVEVNRLEFRFIESLQNTAN